MIQGVEACEVLKTASLSAFVCCITLTKGDVAKVCLQPPLCFSGWVGLQDVRGLQYAQEFPPKIQVTL